MKKETRLYFRDLLDDNGSIDLLLKSDFSFVNGRLAQLYGLGGIVRPEFQKTRLTDPRRGGLLGQASVLTVPANGVETSPVVRGVWVLKNILGTLPRAALTVA